MLTLKSNVVLSKMSNGLIKKIMCELLQGIWNLKSEWMKMNCTLWLQLVILVCKYEPIYISRIKKRWPWHRSRSRQIHSATVFQHFVIIVIINRTMCVHVKVFHSKVKAVNMLTAHSVKSSVSQIIIDCFFRSCIQ